MLVCLDGGAMPCLLCGHAVHFYRPPSQFRRNLLGSDESGANGNNLSSTSLPPSLVFNFWVSISWLTKNVYMQSSLDRSIEGSDVTKKVGIPNGNRQRYWRDKKLDCYMLDQLPAGNFRIRFINILSSSPSSPATNIDFT